MRAVAFVLTAAVALCASDAAAQSPRLTTQTANEVNVSASGYNYTEPDGLAISIHGPKIGGEYIGTKVIDPRRQWFVQASFRGQTGHTTYDGWCSPFLIVPNGNSPNGWALDLGDAQPCSESGDPDWYLETRGMIGKDFTGSSVVWAPYSGLGYRYLSNGLVGIPGYRIQQYLYLPLGITARFQVGSHGVLSLNAEYDQLLHGWNTTYDSYFGSGDIPATPTAPAFTLNGFTDVSFDQHSGFAFRAGAKYQMTSHISLEPYYIRWHVSDSNTNGEIATYTVNGITAQAQFLAYEPRNVTNEFGVKLGIRFGRN
ncbi:MAG TPA: hypothetical protein VFV78_03060 [Vicinamibacterales bacterium]|nr:hypothetical protein [Vicinamibacterales bacterium]